MSSQEFRHIVRIMGTDSPGTLKTSYAVKQVRGINMSMSNAVLKKAGVNPDLRVGFITDSDISKIEDVIRDPAKHGIPGWLYNRQKDSETGNDVHLLSAELIFKVKTDIDQAKEIRSWRGYRHAYSLKVRGQRTKCTGRAGKALGVKKKTLQQKPSGAVGGK
ncbi:MAG: 30S ribosomal protein S13 [Nitrososphaerota archaeon]|uniref:30S ribosomal protein S13 n=1 Tax=Candidatus Bathycorpusculum sp. TaxID=2994959 RepID=UPI0028214879|nr:30S ribosomal protein S13 [Candidatus Termiticorpusculum sp.]MCL2256960.1 30S ribosomal protein S13 [Candidatus Termiticorpusculum sp.]MCL2292916.1 30S ribosomal protein S13 [Candidatus Termiticorpusculum sp.]MDR0460968.1 30S ribosomal protein S13 [Nitrososphaerota archaeon]